MRRSAALAVLALASPLLAAEPKVHRGLAYADTRSERQTLDVYTPAEGKNRPVVVWIHGGGWHSGDKKDVKQKPRAFTDKGFVFVSINYRLQVWTYPHRSPGVTIKQIAEDVAKAIHWTHDHAGDFGGDPSAIFVMGHSAGAQLAALVCTDNRYLKAEKLSLSIIKGCVPVDGDTYDLPMRISTVHKKGDKKLAERDKQRFGDEATQKDLSSITHIAKGKHIPPFLILHVADHPETRGQSLRLLQVLKEARIPASTFAAEGKNHTTLNDDLGTPDDKPTKAVWEFMSLALKKR
jgi:acetyl esterase/lipase